MIKSDILIGDKVRVKIFNSMPWIEGKVVDFHVTYAKRFKKKKIFTYNTYLILYGKCNGIEDPSSDNVVRIDIPTNNMRSISQKIEKIN